MQITVESISHIIALVTGLVGMPIIQFLKNQMNLSGNKALGISAVSSIVLSIAVLFAQGYFAGQPTLSLDAIASSSAQVFAVASIFYKLIQSDK